MQKYKDLEDFFANTDPTRREQVQDLRAVILAHPGVTEHLKWNAPSYVYKGEDRVTFNLMNKEGVVKLVLHMGATKKEDKKGAPVLRDDSGLLQWSSDIRAMISFADLADVQAKRAAVSSVVERWLAIDV